MKSIEKFIAITMSLVMLLTGMGNLYVNAAKKAALSNKKSKKEKIDKKDMGVKLCDEDIGCFVSDHHFYFCPKREELLYNEENPGVFEVCRDKGEKIGRFNRGRENRIINWGKYGEKLYFVLRRKERQVEAENSSHKNRQKL